MCFPQCCTAAIQIFCGHAFCSMKMNHLQNYFLCASSTYLCHCCLNQKNLYRSSILLGTSRYLVLTLLICPAWEILLVAVLLLA